MTFTIRSSAFSHNDTIPGLYTCDGEDISPPLEWSGIPAGTKSLALIVEDPDAPDPAAPKMTWIHWVLYNIPSEAGNLEEDIATANLPPGTKEGKNNWGRTGYGGPCPPIGRHRYYFRLFALSGILPDLGQPSRTQLEQAMTGQVLAEAELLGLYERSG